MEDRLILKRTKRILINDGPEFIEFSPDDTAFVERFYDLLQDLEVKQADYHARAEKIDGDKALDANGLPANLKERLAFLREVCEYMRAKIDHLFGDNASQAAFGDVLSLELIGQFLDGITPFITTARAEKVRQHLNAKQAGRVMK